jgi:hypothetical protein
LSQENLDLVRRSTWAFNDRDLDALELTFCEDVVMRLAGEGGFSDLAQFQVLNWRCTLVALG